MSSEFVITMAERSVYVVLLVSGPLLALALIVGLIVSVFQATTQIQEQTLAFIPKLLQCSLDLLCLVLGCFQQLCHLQQSCSRI